VAASRRQGSRLEHHRHAVDVPGNRSSVGWRGAAAWQRFDGGGRLSRAGKTPVSTCRLVRGRVR
jgi:hypothetical protein